MEKNETMKEDEIKQTEAEGHKKVNNNYHYYHNHNYYHHYYHYYHHYH